MKKMLRFQVIDFGFAPIPQDDQRLTVEGKDFNDFQYGSGWSRKSALNAAIELIEEHGVECSCKGLIKEMENASTEEQGDTQYTLAVRYYFDRTAEDAQVEANIMKLWNERHELLAAGELGVDTEPVM
jgi:hypothetical protein